MRARHQGDMAHSGQNDICYEMAQISELMGQTDKAIGYYKEIYSVDISYKDVSDKIEKAYKK